MPRKLKITGFARFLLLMVFIGPAAYIGASYYNGEDGIANIKKLLHMPTSSSTKEETPKIDKAENTATPSTDTEEDAVKENSRIAKMTDELAFKNRQMDTLYLENTRLKQQLTDKEKELKTVQAQLDKIRKAIGKN